ncbi:MAG TPA: tetratricopeptide repeat protein, partial [Anaerolineaceae bacterium]|nr:tetratricopeptide repeat protein [Anaerolineaceae bacterium]
AMAEKMDAEQVGDLMDTIWQRLDTLIYEHGGLIDKHIGDAVVAVWGAGEAQENDPEQAVHTALALQNEINLISAERSQPIRMRMGIHTGLVYVTPGDAPGRYNITGMPLQMAESIQRAAPPGGILITYDTLVHIRGVFNVTTLEPLDLKDIPNPVQIYLVRSARPRAFRMGTRGIEGIETRMIGRDTELQRLKDLFVAVTSNATMRMVTITGEAGVGKSRLLHEFDQWVDSIPQRVRYFKGRAGLDMQRTPYSLLRDLFAFRFQILDTDDTRTVWQKMENGVAEALPPEKSDKSNLYAHFIGHLIGFDFSQSPLLSGILSDSRQMRNRALEYIAEYFHSFCTRLPVMILLEDIQWADQASLEAIQTLADNLENCPVLILCTARPQFYERSERKSKWTERGEQLYLNPLSPQSTRELVQHILQKISQIPEALIELMSTSAEGNPFYVEELTKMLIEDGVILKGEETWQVDVSRLTTARVPSTLTGVLQARLDSLQTRERQALQSAAVVGPIFWDTALAHLFLPPTDSEHSDLIEEILTGLRAKEMIYRRDKSAFSGTLEYIFKNVVLREVAYESIPKRERRTSHARVADWLIRVTEQSGRQDEYARLVAEHFERAGETLLAAEWYARAAQQAATRFATQEAIYCFSRALELTPSEGENLSARYSILTGREQMYDLQAERGPQMQDLEAITALAENLPGSSPRIQSALRRANYGLVTGTYGPAIQAAEQAYALAKAAGDLGFQAQATVLWAQAFWRQSEYDLARDKLHTALELSRRAGLLALEAESLRNLGVIEQDQGNYSQAGIYFEQTLTLYQRIGDRVGEANTYSSLGNLAIDLSDHASACAYHEMSLQLRRETGDRRGQARSLGNLGFIASDQGDYAASQGYFEQALRLFRLINDRQGEAVALVNLGNDSMIQGNYVAALAYQEQALKIQREIQNRLGESIALDNLSLLSHYLGDQSKALEYSMQALEIAKTANLRHVMGYIYNHHGHALLELGNPGEAEAAYRLSLQLRREVGEHNLALEALSGLVRVSLYNGDISTAHHTAQELYQAIQNVTLDGMVEPFRCYLTIYQAMHAAGDEQAREVLCTAHQLLHERAAKILDPEQQRMFLENVPAHRQILELFAATRAGSNPSNPASE